MFFKTGLIFIYLKLSPNDNISMSMPPIAAQKAINSKLIKLKSHIFAKISLINWVIIKLCFILLVN